MVSLIWAVLYWNRDQWVFKIFVWLAAAAAAADKQFQFWNLFLAPVW